MLVVAAFSGLALALAAVGIYGVTSYTVSARRAEIGIRRALGASRPRLASSVLGRLGALTAAGVLLGLIGAVAGERLVGSLLVGVRPGDPAVLLGVAALLAVVALAASAVPLARAMRVAPTEALRPD
jgi:putative ABC transport system permease protein